MPVNVGTSGWQYRDWRGVLYPAGLAQSRWFDRYTRAFATVENNSAFYRLPSHETFASWHARMPADFTMAVKASRFLTHIRRLRDAEEPVRRLLAAAAGLGDKLGPILLQLPPTLRADPERLEACLTLFPATLRVAVEPRHETWWNDDVRSVLESHDAALCWADVLGRATTPLWRTSSWGYLRLHQGAASPWPHYGDQTLRAWRRRLGETWPDDDDVYVYFNNDPGAAAIRDAVRFAELLRDAGRTTSRTPDRADIAR